MTTIAWSKKSGRIAADRQSSYHGNQATKLYELPDGSIVGTSGAHDQSLRAVAWLRDESKERPSLPAEYGSLMRAYPDGRAVYYHAALEAMPISFEFWAIGSGADYAMGAMARGATPEEAVEIASRYDEHTGGGIDVKYLPTPMLQVVSGA